VSDGNLTIGNTEFLTDCHLVSGGNLTTGNTEFLKLCNKTVESDCIKILATTIATVKL